MEEPIKASDIAKESEKRFKEIDESKRKEREESNLESYKRCLRSIESSALGGEFQAECNRLAPKYQELLKESGYTITNGKYTYRNDLYTCEYTGVSWGNRKPKFYSNPKEPQSFFGSLFSGKMTEYK